MIPLYIFLALFLASFVQGSIGFGAALVAMPVLTLLLTPSGSVPLMALLAGSLSLIMLLRYRQSLNWRATTRMSAGSLVGIPLGVFLLRQIDADLVVRLLGGIILAYGVYALLDFKLPPLKNRAWGYGFGFLGGVLSGAYNTGGPPVVIYANCRRWRPVEFKSNLQGYFLINSAAVILTHWAMGDFTPLIIRHYFYGLPAVVLGLGAGFLLDGRVNAALFRKVVLIFLIILGIKLLFF